MVHKPTLGYWNFRGLAQPIRLMLAYAGVNWDDKRYSKGADGKGTEWQNVKFTLGLDFPNLPYYIDDHVKLTQTIAILRHLARKHSLQGHSEEEWNRIEMIEQQIVDWNNAFFQTIFNPNFVNIREEYVQSLNDVLKLVTNFLANHQYAAGNRLTYVDFWLYEYLVRVKVFAPQVYNQHHTLERFVQRIEHLPRVAEYIKQQGPQPFVSEFGSQWNGKY